MEHVRIIVEAPRDGEVFVIDATPTSTVVDLTSAPFADFLTSIQRNLPFRVQAEPVGVVWKALIPGYGGVTGTVATGVVAVNATVTPTATANQQGGYQAPNTDPDVLHHFDPSTTAIVLMAATGSGHLRFTSQQ